MLEVKRKVFWNLIRTQIHNPSRSYLAMVTWSFLFRSYTHCTSHITNYISHIAYKISYIAHKISYLAYNISYIEHKISHIPLYTWYFLLLLQYPKIRRLEHDQQGFSGIVVFVVFEAVTQGDNKPPNAQYTLDTPYL